MTQRPNNAISPDMRRMPSICVILGVLAAVALPRLLLLGGLPATDEGVYAYFAQIMHGSLASGKGLPDAGTLMFYPLLLNWIYGFDVNPIVALRLADMLVSVAAGYVLYRVIELESRSRLGALVISLLFLFTMNQPMFIQSGFKNSMFASYLALFAALWLGLTAADRATTRRWMSIGALLAVAVLLRETFLLLAAFGALAVLLERGLRPFAQLVAGALATGMLVAMLVLAARGGSASLVDSYREASGIYAAMADQRTELFFNSGSQFLRESSIALAVGGIGFVVALTRSFRKDRVSGLPKLGFWLAAALIPFIEPATKIGFPYHFSACLPGVAGLAALGWRNTCEEKPAYYLQIAGAAMAITFLCVLSPRVGPLTANWAQTREVLAIFPSGKWPEAFMDKSNYLLAAQTIREATPPGGSVAVSGYMYALYPLTGSLPPSPELANLSNTIIKLELSGPRLREVLLRCPPDVVMTTSRTEWPGGPEILAAVRETGIYEEVAEIPTTNVRAYGTFGGIVFRAKKRAPCEALSEL